MRWICSDEANIAWYHRRQRWHRWFAWYPVTTNSGETAWLEFVWQRGWFRRNGITETITWNWEYRTINEDDEQPPSEDLGWKEKQC